MSDQIIVAGDPWPVPGLTVHTWVETGMRFSSKKKRAETRAIVLHWTGSENAPNDLFRNMRTRTTPDGTPDPVSVHFAIDQPGDVWQFMDTTARAAHCKARKANDWSIGIELINRGSALTLPAKGVERELRVERFNGREIRYLAFTSAQLRSACSLVAALCQLHAIPMAAPVRAGKVHDFTMTEAEAARYVGVLGHRDLEPGKTDPGLEIMLAIHNYGLRSPRLIG